MGGLALSKKQKTVDTKAPKLGATLRIARDVVAEEGWSALYRGLSPNLVGNMAGWSLYFMLYVSPHQPVLLIGMIWDGRRGGGLETKYTPYLLDFLPLPFPF